jgi:hypothetical protein
MAMTYYSMPVNVTSGGQGAQGKPQVIQVHWLIWEEILCSRKSVHSHAGAHCVTESNLGTEGENRDVGRLQTISSTPTTTMVATPCRGLQDDGEKQRQPPNML